MSGSHPVSTFRVLLVLVGLTMACSEDQRCPSCPSPGERPIPRVSGVWTVDYSEYISGGLAFQKHFVMELAQFDSTINGRIGGTITSCLSGFGCFTDILYNTYVSGRVMADSDVVLQWIEDTTLVAVAGRVEPAGMSGAKWHALRQNVVGIEQSKGRSGETVIVRGIVTVSAGKFEGGTRYPGNVIYVQDGTAGIEVVGLFTEVSIHLGDSVLVHAVSDEDGYGERALVPIDVSFGGVDPRPAEIARLGSGVPLSPRLVTAGDFSSRTYEGSLVTLRGMRLVSRPASATGGYVVTLADNADTRVSVTVHRAVASTVSLASWVIGATYDITGIQGSSNGTPNLQIRGSGDRVLR